MEFKESSLLKEVTVFKVSTVSNVHSDRKGLFEKKNGPLIAVNGR